MLKLIFLSNDPFGAVLEAAERINIIRLIIKRELVKFAIIMLFIIIVARKEKD